MKKTSLVVASAALMLCAVTTSVQADVADFSAAQQANANLIHQWNFDGLIDSIRLKDLKGSADLERLVGEGSVTDDNGTPGDTGDDIVTFGQTSDITFEPGFGGIGHAYRPSYVDPSVSSTAGAALAGTGFTTPENFTIEAVVKADAKTTASAVNYIFMTRPSTDRGYFLIQEDMGLGRGAIGGLGTIVGNSFGDEAIGVEYESDGTWIYIAASISLPVGGPYTADIYAANLSAGDTTLSLVSHSYATVADALSGLTGNFSIGAFAVERSGDQSDGPEAVQEFFQGAIDSVAVYDRNLSASELQQNLNQIVVPEPASLVLLGLGALLMPLRRRAA